MSVARRFRDLRKVHPCPIPDHAELGLHLHEVLPGQWRLYQTKENTDARWLRERLGAS